MRLLTFSYFDSPWDKSAKPLTARWDEWRTALTTHEHRGSPRDTSDKTALERSKRGPAIVLGSIAAGLSHANRNVTLLDAVALDIENVPEARILEAAQALAAYEWILVTTHKHGALAVSAEPELRARVRLVLPLERSVTPAEHALLWRALQKRIGGIADEQTKNAARLYYLPSTYDPSIAWSHHNAAAWLRPEDLLGQGSNAPPSAQQKAVTIPFEESRIRRALASLSTMNRLYATSEDGIDLRLVAQAVCKGEPFAVGGLRHRTVLAITLWLVRRYDKRKELPPQADAVGSVFAASLAVMARAESGAPTVSEVIAAYEGAIEKSREWTAQDREVKSQALLEAARALQHPAGGSEYTTDELCAIARAIEVPHEPDTVATALQRRWILQASSQAFYLLDHAGIYRGPFDPSIGRTAAVTLLSRAPVILNLVTPQGTKRRTLQELCEDYGQACEHIVLDLTRTRSYFDSDISILFDAACPLRSHLVPRFDPGIDQWLRVFAGRMYDKLLDWMACAPDLDKLLCALYLSGAPSAGKTLFGHGMARLWADSPARFDLAFGDFNQELVRCPLILADEDLGGANVFRKNLSAEIRTLVSTLDRTVNRKYLPTATLHGAVRLVIAANNDYLLATKESLSARDLAAIAQRFLYIASTEEAGDLMAETSSDVKEGWKDHGLAEHALWLRENRTVKSGARFWVEGDMAQMHRLLAISSDWTSKVCEWLVRFLQAPQIFTQRNDGLVRLGEGALLVNEQAIVDGWRLYLAHDKTEPETSKIGAALRAISDASRVQLRWRGRHIRYRKIQPDLLLAWSDQFGIATRDVLERAIGSLAEEATPSTVTDNLATALALNAEGMPQ